MKYIKLPMKNSFTLNELISFVCNGKSENNMSNVEIANKKDHRRYSNSEMLDSGLSISPDKRIINNILNYSRALSIVQTKNSGNFRLMMN